MDLLPPRWIDVQDEVDDMLKEITLKSARLDKLHAQHVLPGFDDEHIKQAEEREIEALTQDITRGFLACQKAITRIDGMVKEARRTQRGGAPLSQGDEVMAANIQMALAVRVQEVSATFRKKQSNYLSKLRQHRPEPLLRPGPARLRDRQISREREINDIAHGIVELADIFRDLQAMVIDQGTMLDRIDYNVERMATDVKGAEKELVVATSYQRKTTKRKILLLLVLLVVGMTAQDTLEG
ncbi:hypothetical protein DV738_g5377, partial [Chaetothyriales sp. CBS 135597]